MTLFIVRITENGDRTTRTRLPGYYGDGQQAVQAMEKVLATYPHHGRNDEHGYWWARDDQNRQFKFEISGAA
jgi:hypothetical protein